MDPVTHGLAGAVINNLGFKRRLSLHVLLLSSVAPDIDYMTRVLGTEAFLKYHRGITHSVTALFVVSMCVLVLVGFKRSGLFYSFLVMIGYGFHLLLDLTNKYGVRLFYPLDQRMYSLDLTFILDPYVSAGCLLSVIVARQARKRARLVALATVLLLVFYMGVRQHYHDRALEFLRESKKDYRVSGIYPLPNDFLRWWFVARTSDKIKVGFADLFTERVYIHRSYPQQGKDPAIDVTRQLGVIESFLLFAKHPYAEVRRKDDRVVVTWKELSYAYSPGERYTARVVIDNSGKVLSSGFRF
jgi:inner membrane protein